MANININPYGQNAEMPEGYPIADNLSTDSAQQALSAKQGKILGDWRETYEPVDISEISATSAYITSNIPGDSYANKWTDLAGYKCLLIPITAGKKYRLTGGLTVISYALLTSGTHTAQTTPSYATGYTEVITIAAGNSVEFTAPSNAVYLYTSYATPSSQKTPKLFKASVSDSLDDIVEMLRDEMGSPENMPSKAYITIAASDAPAWQKVNADFQCDGVNDELTIQQAVNAIYATKGGILRLSSGTFNIESFPNQQTEDDCTSYAAILIPSSDNTADGYEIRIVGDVIPYSGASSGGTHIRVTDAAYANLDSNKFYRIFAARYVSNIISKAKVSVHFSNFTINLPWNQRKIMCIDCHSINKVDMRFVTCSGYTSGYSGGWTVDLTTPPAKAVQGCIGVRMVSGSNFGCIIDFRNCGMNGFYEGWQVGGEHTVMINCSAIYNVYGYTFGNYAWKHATSHNITMINCCDEKNVNLPYFANNGGPVGSTYGNQGQAVTMIDFNLERMYDHPEYVPGGVLGDNMKERVPGTFYGEISYAMTDWAKTSSADKTNNGYKVVVRPLWDTAKINGKCHGQNMKTRNQYHEVATTKSILATYAPNYLQQVWLTDENKMVYCIDTANKTWVDAQGNAVSLS